MNPYVYNQRLSCFTVLLGPTLMSLCQAYVWNTSEYASKFLGFGKRWGINRGIGPL